MIVDIKVANGTDLDLYCWTIDHILSAIRDELEIVNPAVIPSDAQREAFNMLKLLLRGAESFTGTLRYDVQCSHESCPEHDDYARRKVEAVKAAIAAFPNIAK
jgi:hypothetical protein